MDRFCIITNSHAGLNKMILKALSVTAFTGKVFFNGVGKMIVFDIDGTLSIVGDRLKYLETKDWDSFYNRCGEDLLNYPIAMLYRRLISKFDVIVVTGRRESCRDDTLEWFKRNGLILEYKDLYMRPDGDKRHDTIVKFEQIEHLISSVNLVFEDRNSMVKAWRDRGVTVCQVAEGDF